MKEAWQITYKRQPYGRKYATLDDVLEAFSKLYPCLHGLGWKKVNV